MKFLVQIILVLFVFVHTAPSLVCFFDNEKSITVSLADEDENSKEEKEFKAEFVCGQINDQIAFNQKITKEITSDYLIKDYKVYPSLIVIPPKAL